MSSEVLLDRYQGRQFNSPNDVVLYCDGSIWLTGESLSPRRETAAGLSILRSAALNQRMPFPGSTMIITQWVRAQLRVQHGHWQ